MKRAGIGILKGTGKGLWGITKLGAKGLYKTAKAGGKFFYNHRESIARSAGKAVKRGGKVIKLTGEQKKEFSLDEIGQIREQADSDFNRKDFRNAYYGYESLSNKLLQKLDETRLARKLAKLSGWVAALLTGGFGLEDILIVPGVNKLFLKIFGIDITKLLELLGYSLRQRHLCLSLADDELVRKIDYQTELTYFTLNYKLNTQVTESKRDKLKALFDLINPMSSDEVGLKTIQQNKTLNEIYDILLVEIERSSPDVERLNAYLFSFLKKTNQTDSPIYIRLQSKGYTV